MSVLRLLSPIRESGPSPSADHVHSNITLDLRMPSHGLVFMKPPDDPLWPHGVSSDLPREDELLTGVLEIYVPVGGRRRCRSIRVGLRTKCKLNMGTRNWEEDTIFERRAEMMGGNSDGVVLVEGLQLFEITLILPSTLAPNETLPNGIVTHELFAEIEGIPEPDVPSFSPLSLLRFGRRSHSRSSYSSPSRSPHTSPYSSPVQYPKSPSSPISPLMAATGSMAITRQEEDSFALAPTYAQSQAANGLRDSGVDKDEWIIGTLGIVRRARVKHNPNPTGEVSSLNINQAGFLEDLGIWELRITSEALSVGGPIHARFTLPSPDPKLTIFAWSLSLRQTHTIASPRDDPGSNKSISSTRVFTIMKRGTKPESTRSPGVNHAAVWRGTDARGDDEGDCTLSASAYLPSHDYARPTTLPGIITPINISHVLQLQLYFSVWGQDDKARPMREAGPGGMRYMEISKTLILPSCSLISSSLDLPKYELDGVDKTCTECGGLSDVDVSGNLKSAKTSAFQHLSNIPPMNLPPGEAGFWSCSEYRGPDPSPISSAQTNKLCLDCRRKHNRSVSATYGFVECACDLSGGDMADRMKALDMGDWGVDQEREARGRKEAQAGTGSREN